MNERKNDKWLDELISGAINTKKPEFDAEKFKQKFPDEFQTLRSRAKVPARFVKWPALLKSPIVKFAAAAVIIIVIGFFIIYPASDKKLVTTETANAKKSPAELLTLRSLKIAYLNGGMEAVETQCDNAIEKLGPKSKKITIQELLTEINGV
ncbi:MAG: hypothetical protein JW715_01610 [Sedimentisphaerales bacterium]|nr:hypothetical protein [Sedimentisphaerales bacterium]